MTSVANSVVLVRCAIGLTLIAALVLGGGCTDEQPGVDVGLAQTAAESDQSFDDILTLAADDGVTAEAARLLALTAVRRAPVLTRRAETEPEVVGGFVAALVDADPDTVGPLTAAVVEALGLALHDSLADYSSFDFDTDAPGIIPPLAEILSSPSRDQRPLADAVRESAADDDAVWAALLATLDAAGTPRDGSLLADVDDDTLAALGTTDRPATAPGDLDQVGPELGAPLRAALAPLLHTEAPIRAAVDLDGPPDLTLDEFVERPAVAGLLDTLTDPGGTSRDRNTPAAVLARLVVPIVP